LKVVIEKIMPDEEEVVVIKYHQLRPKLLQAISILEMSNDILIAYQGKEVFRIAPADIYYIESVNSKVFIYCKEAVYDSRQTLQELENVLRYSDFARSSKTMLINLDKVTSFTSAPGARLKATLDNDEKVLVSRYYVREIKRALGLQDVSERGDD